MSRVDLQRAAEAASRLVRQRQPLQHDTKIDQGIDVVRRALEHALEPLAGRVKLVALEREHAQVETRLDVGGIELQDRLQVLAGCHDVAFLCVSLGQIQMTNRVVRRQGKRPAQRIERLARSILVQQREAEPHAHRGRRAWQRRGSAQRALGIGEPAEHEMRQPEMLQREPVALMARCRLFQQRQRLHGVARDEARNSEQAQRLGVARSALDDFFAQALRSCGISALKKFLGLLELAVREGGHRQRCMPRDGSPPS